MSKPTKNNGLQRIARKTLDFFSLNGRTVSTSDTDVGWFTKYFGEETYDNKESVKRGYGENPYMFMVIDRIASIGASLPRQLIDKKTGKAIENNRDKEGNEFLALINKPNSYEDKYEFYYKLIANLLLGNLYVHKISAIGFEGGVPSGLVVPVSTEVNINENLQAMQIDSYSFQLRNKLFNNIKPNEVLHLKRPNIISDKLEGLSTLFPSAALWNTSNEIFKSGYSLHKNKGIQGILFGKGGSVITPKEQKTLQEYYEQTFGNNKAMAKVKINSTEVGYVQMGTNPNDLKSIEANLDILRAICSIFNVASQLFGDVAASTYANMEQAEEAMYTNAIIPICERIDVAMSEWLLPNESFKYCLDKEQIPILQAIKSELSVNTIAQYEKGLITLEEARSALGRDGIIPQELIAKPIQNQNNENNVIAQ